MTTFCGDCEYLNRHDEYNEWLSGDTKFKCNLISEYKITRVFIMDNKYVNYANMSWYKMIICTLLTALFIYVVCSIIDYIRKKIFELIKIHKLSEKVVEIIKNVYIKSGKIINKI